MVNLGEFIYRSEYVSNLPPCQKEFWPMAELGVNFAQLQLGLHAAWLSLAIASVRLPVVKQYASMLILLELFGN